MLWNQSLNVIIAVTWWRSVVLVKTGHKCRCCSSIFALLGICSAVSYLGFLQTMHFLCTLLIQYQGVDKHEYFTRFQIETLVWSPNLHHLWQCTNHFWRCLYRSHSFKDAILCILYTASVFLVYILLQVCFKRLPTPPQTHTSVHIYIIYVTFTIFCLRQTGTKKTVLIKMCFILQVPAWERHLLDL